MRAAASKGSRRSLGTLGRNALTWWLGELAALVPGRFRQRRRAVAEIHVTHDLWTIQTRGAASTQVDPRDETGLAAALAALRGRRKQTAATLVVPLSRCFSRSTELPRAMLGHARSILVSELEMSTPFHANQVYWDWFARGEGAEPGTVAIIQIVLKRRDADAIIQGLRDAGITIAAIGVEDDTASPGPLRLSVDLQRHARRGSDEASQSLSKARGVLIGAAVLTGIAVVPAAFYQQASTLAALNADIADATDAVATRPGLARPALKALGDALETKRAGPSAAQIMDALATALPPDSHLGHLYLDHDVLTLQGQTRSSRGLERSLAASPLFSVGHNTAAAAKDDGLFPFTIRLKTKPILSGSGA